MPLVVHEIENMRLTPPQLEVMNLGLLSSGYSCVLQMPTGSGKTWLAFQSIQQTLARGFRAIYVSPTRALAQELYQAWSTKPISGSIGIFTGDYGKPGVPFPVSFREATLLIMTPERLDNCIRYWRTHWSWIPEIDLVVLDEFHLLGEGNRGGRLEGTIMRLRRLNPFVRFLGLSATLGNREELADWLDGVEFRSHWRPVPITWRTIKFRKADEKPELLQREVSRVIGQGGKTLVFAQSRRRAESLASHLRNVGFRAAHHHAGLGLRDRTSVEEGFRENKTDVLVATATLEVGLNLPVRQVVLYDLQEFDGNEFSPLRTTSVWQRIGRAGRPGLDSVGEAVLFAPFWDTSVRTYAAGNFETCLSVLSNVSNLSEQIVTEVASGLSRTRTELDLAFEESLAAKQQRLTSVANIVTDMCAAGILVEASPSEMAGEPKLKATPLGRIAVRHMLAPESVLVFKAVLANAKDLTLFDLLLLACSSKDFEPILATGFEELSDLSQALREEKSALLLEPIDALCGLLRITVRRLLCAIKSALALRSWTQLGDREKVAERFDCYPSDIFRLAESFSRLIPGMIAIANPELDNKSDEEHPPKSELTSLITKTRALAAMISGGIDEYIATLTLVGGIGVVWAKRLDGIGIVDLEKLAQSEATDICEALPVSSSRAQKWIYHAREILLRGDSLFHEEWTPRLQVQMGHTIQNLDPYRFRRSLSLSVESSGDGIYRVTGGLDSHIVRSESSSWICDCLDHAKGHVCKHELAVRRVVMGDRIEDQFHVVRGDGGERLLDLGQLWMSR